MVYFTFVLGIFGLIYLVAIHIWIVTSLLLQKTKNEIMNDRVGSLMNRVKVLETEKEAQQVTNCDLHKKNVEMVKRVNDLEEINEL